jgi:hypothetical protein
MHYNNTRNGRRSITKKTEQGSKSANWTQEAMQSQWKMLEELF